MERKYCCNQSLVNLIWMEQNFTWAKRYTLWTPFLLWDNCLSFCKSNSILNNKVLGNSFIKMLNKKCNGWIMQNYNSIDYDKYVIFLKLIEMVWLICVFSTNIWEIAQYFTFFETYFISLFWYQKYFTWEQEEVFFIFA